MPGRGSYGHGGKWIYQRAKHIRSKNPDMDESTSFAIATQQAHKLGRSPKKFRTAAGVAAAKRKYRGPLEMYKKTAGVDIGGKGRRLLGRAKRVRLRKPTGSEGAAALSVASQDDSKTASVRVAALFDELEKLGAPIDLLARTATTVGGQAVKHPGAAYWRYKQQKGGLSKHEQTMLALKHGYPAGWVSMGIRPR